MLLLRHLNDRHQLFFRKQKFRGWPNRNIVTYHSTELAVKCNVHLFLSLSEVLSFLHSDAGSLIFVFTAVGKEALKTNSKKQS